MENIDKIEETTEVSPEISDILQAMVSEEAFPEEMETEVTDYIKDNLVVLEKNNLSGITIDEKEFQAGVKSVSNMLGAISAFVSIGVNPNKAMDYLTDKEVTKDALKHNSEMAKMATEAQVEVARYEQRHIKTAQI